MPSQTKDRPVPPPVLGELSPVESQASVFQPSPRAQADLLTPARVRSLLLAEHELPEMTSANETVVSRAIQRVRSRRK